MNDIKQAPDEIKKLKTMNQTLFLDALDKGIQD